MPTNRFSVGFTQGFRHTPDPEGPDSIDEGTAIPDLPEQER